MLLIEVLIDGHIGNNVTLTAFVKGKAITSAHSHNLEYAVRDLFDEGSEIRKWVEDNL